MIDRGWIFFGAYSAYFPIGTLSVSYSSGNTIAVDMTNWRVTRNGIPAINVGAGAQAIINNDGVWAMVTTTLSFLRTIRPGSVV